MIISRELPCFYCLFQIIDVVVWRCHAILMILREIDVTIFYNVWPSWGRIFYEARYILQYSVDSLIFQSYYLTVLVSFSFLFLVFTYCSEHFPCTIYASSSSVIIFDFTSPCSSSFPNIWSAHTNELDLIIKPINGLQMQLNFYIVINICSLSILTELLLC